MTVISARINQITDPKERLKQRLEHDQTIQGIQLHFYQRRPDDGQLGTPVGFQLIPSTFSPTTQTPVA